MTGGKAAVENKGYGQADRDPGSTGLRVLFHSFTGDLAHAELKLCIGIATIRPAMEFAFIHPLLGVQRGGKEQQAGQKEGGESHGV